MKHSNYTDIDDLNLSSVENIENAFILKEKRNEILSVINEMKVQTLNYYGDQYEYEKYSEIINKTVSFNGASFTINSVVCDENSIIIGYTIKSDKIINTRKLPGFMPSFKIN